MTEYRLIYADVIAGLRQIEAESVHCVVTSPPYWGLRNYGIEPSIWGGDPHCVHEWGSRERGKRGDMLPLGESTGGRIGSRAGVQDETNDGGQFCLRCRAWLGCLGLEPSPALFVDHLVEVFRHVRRVLHPSGTVWLNLGDCYVSNPHGTSPSTDPKYPRGRDHSEGGCANRRAAGSNGLKNKDLVMIPARVAIALQDDGWYLRSQIPWIKRNGMPESADDRPTSMVEYVFLLSKSEQYFYDGSAITLPQAEHERTRRLREQAQGLDTRYTVRRDDPTYGQVPAGRNGVVRSVAARQELAKTGVRARRNSDWFLESFRGMCANEDGEPLALLANPQPFALEYCKACHLIYRRSEYRTLPMDRETKLPICVCGESRWLSHFATFPEAMAEPCILAAASVFGCCVDCGAPWERIVEKPKLGDWNANPSHKLDRGAVNNNTRKSIAAGSAPLGWRRTCSHPLFESDPVPCTVLDPFAGSATTGVVAIRHGHRFIAIERNPAYCALAEFRLKSIVGPAGNELPFTGSSCAPAPPVPCVGESAVLSEVAP